LKVITVLAKSDLRGHINTEVCIQTHSFLLP